ncbi:hypothetical protein RIF29_16426 [Crotalaria pallida]|uniref:Uncharacterized protein n=1 Tax=Crotalaria pallida TaxID=3830 RepID=A0AAN9FNQ5_CROPI
MAKTFEGLMRLDKRFEIVVPRYFSLVCFRISPLAIGKMLSNGKKSSDPIAKSVNDKHYWVNGVNRKLLDSINSSGSVYMTHAEVEEDFIIRCAIGATLTKEDHVIMAWKLV